MEKLLILAAGTGSRMGKSSSLFNKALLPIAGKAVLSHIIDNVCADQIVIAVGYKADQIIEYCQIYHSHRDIQFVMIDNFSGPGSGPGYSMYCCKNLLQEKFYIVTADSFLDDNLPPIDCDWIGIAKVNNLETYATCSIDNSNVVVEFQNKSTNFLQYAFTGVAAVKDYAKFWQAFENYREVSQDKELEFVGAFYKPFYTQIHGKEIKWHDVGKKDLYVSVYSKTKGLDDYDLKKINNDEITYNHRNTIAKLSQPEKINKKKLRQHLLADVTPELKNLSLSNFIIHEYVEGKNLYQIENSDTYIEFLLWCEKNLFNKIATSPDGFLESCRNFYETKSYERLGQFYDRFPELNQDLMLGSISCKNGYHYLSKMDWKWLCNSPICRAFHGDLNFSNAIKKNDGNFVLIDWRSDFAGNLVGDLYYDLAKLYAGAKVSFYRCCVDDRYFRKYSDKEYGPNWYARADEEIFVVYYKKWLVEKGYDVAKVQVIAFLIYLNMAPLHLDDLAKYLYFEGIRNLELFFASKV